MKVVRTLSFKEVQKINKVGYTNLGGAVGLYLYIKPSDSKYYVYRFKAADGKRSVISLAPYGSIDLAEARKRAAAWKERLRNGENPSDIRRAELEEKKRALVQAQLQAQKSARTFNYVSEIWLEERSKSGFWANNVDGESHTLRFLTKYIRPIIGMVPIADLNVHNVFDVLKPIYQSMPNTAKKSLTVMSSVWKWAKAKDWVDGENPADIKGSLGVLLEPYKNDRVKGKNHPALDPSDIPDFFVALRGLNTNAARLAEFLILTAARSKMARFLKWSDIDFKNRTATICEVSLKTKGRGSHTIFLSTQAIDLLKAMPRECEYVFYSRANTTFSDAAPGMVFRQLNKLALLSGQSGWLDRRQTKELGKPVIATAHGTARATFDTWFRTGENRKLFDPDAVELCLAHNLKDDYNGAYNRATLEPERRKVMQAWADYCYSKCDK